MKISILLPYKENFSPSYPGAVSLFINDTLNKSKYKKYITVYGNTNFKKKFKHKYFNLETNKNFLKSQNRRYVEKFISIEKKNNSNLIEIHNRPIYVKYIKNEIYDRKLILYFHNDPLSMNGSSSLNDRIYLLNNCDQIIFNSLWVKKRFIQDLNLENFNYKKLLVINQSAKKKRISFKKKKKLITFVGKLNRSKGYDLFGNAILMILKKHKDWKSFVIGDETRNKIYFDHKNLIQKGFLKHDKVIDYLKVSSISVVCSRWEEPFGRTSLESAANGCAVIISNRGGLPETIEHGVILKQLTVKNLYRAINDLIINPKLRTKYQKLSYKSFKLTHEYVSKLIDEVRDNSLIQKQNFYIKKGFVKPRILHVTNFNERHNGRLFFNTGRRINNGFIRLGCSVLEFSDRDIQSNSKNYSDINGSKSLNQKLIKTCLNYKPDLIVLGHADLVSKNVLGSLKDDLPGLRIAQWFLDPLVKKGPDYEKNKRRIMDKMKYLDCSFLTTSPSALKFLDSNKNFFIPNPADPSLEILENFKKNCINDVFFAMSHGVHRGILKKRYYDERTDFIEKLINNSDKIKFDIYGLNNIQPLWADNLLNSLSNSKMGLNLSRGKPTKYYSSDRITQIIGNGLVTLIDEKTQYRDFFNDKEMVFYNTLSDLTEKILKISKDEKLRKQIGRNGKNKYMKYFNSNLVAKFIIEKTFDIKTKNFYWHKEN